MKAIVQDEYGSPDVLRLDDVDPPEIGNDDVLVRVHAAGVDAGVWHVMTGLPYMIRIMGYGLRAPKARIRGSDFAGRVEAVGPNVTTVRPGDAVFGACDGSFAEYARVKEKNCTPKPSNLTFEQAAAVPVSALTALQGLRDHGKIEPGQQVLVIGAGGGVGTFAVQIAKAFGAEVTGVCSSTKLDTVRSIGASHVIDYTREDFVETGRRWDLILDIAGNRSLSHLRRALTPRGTLVIIGGEEGDRWIGGTDRLLRALALSPFVRHNLRTFIARVLQEDLLFLKELIEAGTVTPVVDKTYPLSQAPDAVRHLAAGRARGKVVIIVRGD
jgi:NADPH:quinone reductase-like Zn-dependent oxidoreductase